MFGNEELGNSFCALSLWSDMKQLLHERELGRVTCYFLKPKGEHNVCLPTLFGKKESEIDEMELVVKRKEKEDAEADVDV